MNKQHIIYFVGCDRSGKTTIAKKLSQEINIPYFRNPRVVFNTLYNDLLHCEANIMYEFLKQTKVSVIRDRDFICELVYARVFGRKTDEEFIWYLDEIHAELGAVIIYCYKDNYDDFDDKFIPPEKINLIKQEYENYLLRTKMKYLKLNTTIKNSKGDVCKIKNFLQIGD